MHLLVNENLTVGVFFNLVDSAALRTDHHAHERVRNEDQGF